jgi:hypothetical protein
MFNIGDKVKCIDKTSLELELNKEYTIKDIGIDWEIEWVYLNEINSIFPFVTRSFEKCSG